jgi:hypothetical protein
MIPFLILPAVTALAGLGLGRLLIAIVKRTGL